MPSYDSDRNLLFGALAVQMDFVTAEQLVSAMNAWMLAKERSIGEILVEQGVLTSSERGLLGDLVEGHLRRHSGDARESLRSVKVERSVHRRLASIADPDIRASSGWMSSFLRAVDLDTDDSLADSGSPSHGVGQSTSAGARFRVLRPHARGGLGVVSLALDTELNREVALKEIKPNRASDANSRGRFVLEAEVTGGLEHPGVVPVYGFGRHADGRPFYAMRFIRGRTLKQAIEEFHRAGPRGSSTERNLAFRELLDRFTDVCQAVEYAHSRGVLHRDIKPDNVMLGKYGETLLVDWGLAKSTGAAQGEAAESLAPLTPSGQSGSEETAVGTAMGTPQYMPPEQAEGRLDLLSARSDVYALGATLASILTGREPVAGRAVAEILARVKAGEVITRGPSPAGVPKALWAVCDKAMAKTPRDRYGSPKELSQEVERYLADEPVSVIREPASVRTRRWMRKHPAVTASVAMGVVLLTMFAMAGFGVVARFNQRLEDANADLERANQREVAARDRAEANFDAAREAVEEYLVKVTENEKLKRADFTELRKELLESAKPFYENLLAMEPDDEKVRVSRAAAFFGLARIQLETGELVQARRNFEECITVFGILTESLPGAPEHRFRLASSHNHLGWLLRIQGEPAEAREHFERSLPILNRLVEDIPSEPEYWLSLAGLHNNLGALFNDRREVEPARRQVEEARAIHERLVARYDSVPEYRRDLASDHYHLGVLLRARWEAGQVREHLEAAREHLETAVKHQGELVAKFPDVPQYRQHVARSHSMLGAVLSDLQQPDRSRLHYETALKLQQELVENFPSVPGYRADLGGAYSNYGQLVRAEDPEASLEWFAKAEQELNAVLEREKQHAPARRFLGITYIQSAISLDRLSRHTEAVLAWQRAAEFANEGEKAAIGEATARSRTLAEGSVRFERILAGEAEPADARERVVLANYCRGPGKKLYLTAARQFEKAFAEMPVLASLNRYNAARASALAGTGRGDDTAELTPDQRAEWRGKALAWLRAELEIRRESAASEDPKVSGPAKETLGQWLQDPDLAGVREPEVMEPLPEEERGEWQAFWQQVRDAAG